MREEPHIVRDLEPKTFTTMPTSVFIHLFRVFKLVHIKDMD